VARSQAALAVLFHVPGAYSLKGLYDYVFDERSRKAAIATAGVEALRVPSARHNTLVPLTMRYLRWQLTRTMPNDVEIAGIRRFLGIGWSLHLVAHFRGSNGTCFEP